MTRRRPRRHVRELPAHDGTRLGRELAELERDDPEAGTAAAALEDAKTRVLQQPSDPTLRLDFRDQVLRAERAVRDLVEDHGLTVGRATEVVDALDRTRSAFEAFATLQLATDLAPEAAMAWLRRHDYVAAVQRAEARP
ncbi:MAG: hypothetical protein GWN84_20765 [Gammaproteobacteria bacterium]|nr:hypothetical protein [Gammaproteobacteria bacterium]NIR85194.1 hypothetical protein [Gammaproteobacteria bacterium]NIU06243.1 hypothetical protein [Gammaproteobacteria bacterium]NIX87516.1 hypothetical protein [Gammaproteobacteria bacterium]